MIAAVATAAGRRVGLHTSPHLVAVTERMRLDGRPAPDAWLAEHVQQHGGRYRPRDLIRRACGEEPSEGPLLDYLETKFGELYAL